MKQFTQQMIVSVEQTAEKMGSGTLLVLATPALVGFMENTAMHLIDNLSEEETSVGTFIVIEHIKASKVGESISCTASLISVEGRKYIFELEVVNATGDIIGRAKHERFVVNTERFMARL